MCMLNGTWSQICQIKTHQSPKFEIHQNSPLQNYPLYITFLSLSLLLLCSFLISFLVSYLSLSQAIDTLIDPHSSSSASPSGAKISQPKPPLLTRIKNEIVHYYHGFRLLGLEISIASRLLRKTLRGQSLSRRELKQVIKINVHCPVHGHVFKYVDILHVFLFLLF